EFPAVIVPAGKSVLVRLTSSDEGLIGVNAQLGRVPVAEARKEHVAQRIPQIRDSFQMLCEARPWMMIGRNTTRESLRRQLKLVDELYTLLEDVRRVEPGEPVT